MSNETLFAKRIEEVEERILDLAGWVGQSHKRPAAEGEIERKVSKVFGIPFHGPPLPLSLPVQLLDDFLREKCLTPRGQNQVPSTEECVEAVTSRFTHAWTLARTMTVAYWDILELYGVEIPDTWRFFRETASRIFSFGILNLGEAYLKHQTAWLLAKSLVNEPPPRPSWFPWAEREGFLTGGPAMRKLWCRLVLRRHKGDVSLAYSLYQAKKVAPEISPLLVQEAMEKNLNLLTEEREDDDVEDLKIQVRRTVRELFHIHGTGGSINSTPFPTLSASYDTPRSKGGALEELLPPNPLMVLAFKELLGFVSYRNRYAPVYRVPVDEDAISIDHQRLSQDLFVRRQAVLEPFKVRVVSMGSAGHYQVARGFQNMLWSLLRRSPVFDLTGRPAEEGDVASIARWVGVFTKQHSVLVSGDYSAATDNLHPELSEACLEELMEGFRIPWKYRSTLLTCLTRHVIVDDEGVPHQQCWGQLMGSMLSFPILCIVNLAITRHVMEESYETYIPLILGKVGHFDYCDLGLDHSENHQIIRDSIKSSGLKDFLEKVPEYIEGICPIKVNGDDILFPLPPGSYCRWIETVTRAGLCPSIGKNYVSRTYAVINSEIFHLHPDWDRGVEEVTRLPYVNLGLLKLVQEHGRGDNATAFVPENYVSTLRERLITATRGFDADFASKLVTYAIRQNREVLGKIPPVSWWTAECYGGLGLPCFRSVKISEHHLKLAAAMVMFDQRMIWSMRHPRCLSELTAFNQATESYIQAIYDELDVPWEYCQDENTWDPLSVCVPKISLGYTCFGAGHSFKGEDFLRRWSYVFNKWMKIIRRNWLVFKPMDQEKALLPTGKRWVRVMKKPDWSCSGYPVHGPLTLSEIQRSEVLDRNSLDRFEMEVSTC